MATQTREFYFKSWNLLDAIDALFAYDSGSRDSGTSDADLRQAVLSYLRDLDDEARHTLLARYARRFLTNDALRAGYGLKDVASFVEWLSDAGISIL
jgi:hypothetical protein